MDPRYEIIGRDLIDLKEFGFIDSRKEKMGRKSGNTPTLYSIVIDIQKMKLMLAKHPRLISEMQKNDLILESIFSEYMFLVTYSTSREFDRGENYSNSNSHSAGTEVIESK